MSIRLGYAIHLQQISWMKRFNADYDSIKIQMDILYSLSAYPLGIVASICALLCWIAVMITLIHTMELRRKGLLKPPGDFRRDWSVYHGFLSSTGTCADGSCLHRYRMEEQVNGQPPK